MFEAPLPRGLAAGRSHQPRGAVMGDSIPMKGICWLHSWIISAKSQDGGSRRGSVFVCFRPEAGARHECRPLTHRARQIRLARSTRLLVVRHASFDLPRSVPLVSPALCARGAASSVRHHCCGGSASGGYGDSEERRIVSMFRLRMRLCVGGAVLAVVLLSLVG
jgi:hypothetical protein